MLDFLSKVEKIKKANKVKVERNKKLLGTIDVYPGMTISELERALGRTRGMPLFSQKHPSDLNLFK